MKKLILLILIATLITASGCSKAINNNTMTIAVGIPPLSGFVQNIAGDNFDIVVLIPSGNSPANYQPTAMEMQQLSEAKLYFTLEMPTEAANILPKVDDFNKNLQVINLKDEVSTIYPLIEVAGHTHDEDKNTEEVTSSEELSVDPHLWLSPKRAIEMVKIIERELSAIDPKNSEEYKKNAEAYISKIETLDSEIVNIVGNLDNKTFMIYHGSYTYFANDYGLKMISLESSGKQATAAEIQEVIEHAMEDDIKVVFYQDEFDDNQAKTVAEEIDGKVEKVSPLSVNYIESLQSFIQALEGQGN